MRNIHQSNIDFESHYRNCVNGKGEPTKSQLLSCIDTLLSLYQQYNTLGNQRALYRLPLLLATDIAPATKKTLKMLYDERMARNGAPGRNVYDKLLEAAAMTCPFCGHGIPTTLDHYLSKGIEQYPELSIAPNNLVPACKDCNHAKGTHVPSNIEDQYWHPYFENADQYLWLGARLEYSLSQEVTVTYFVSGAITDADIKNRIEFQFNSLRLNRLYSKQAATEISGIEPLLRNTTFPSEGADGIRQYAIEQANARSSVHQNSWQAALYRCLASDTQFHRMDWIL